MRCGLEWFVLEYTPALVHRERRTRAVVYSITNHSSQQSIVVSPYVNRKNDININNNDQWQ